MDLCYFLGPESKADDWELRYSLRSWLANYPRLSHIHIVGHLPAWLRPGEFGELSHRCLVHHQFPDPYKSNKDANLIQKTLYLASMPGVSDPFILCSDDQMLLRRVDDDELSVRSHTGLIQSHKKIKGHSWWERLHRTGAALRRHKLTDYHFDTHIPHVVHKHEARSLLRWDYGEGNGYCVFSLLFNGAEVDGQPIDRAPIRAGLFGSTHSRETVVSKMQRNLFLSIDGDSLHNPDIVSEIASRWPERAPWEAYSGRNPVEAETKFDYTPYTIK